MKKVIYQDQRIAEEFCNLKCEYCEGFCPTGYSLSVDQNYNLGVPDDWFKKINKMPPEVRKYFNGTRKMSDFYDLSYDVVERSLKILNADILKISGGEITIYTGLIDFVKKVHEDYKLVQILTNGININENDLKEYKKLKNITFQISLDGVDYYSNYARTHNEKVTKKILKNIDNLIKYEFGIEINCVLTKYNTNNFMDLLKRFKGTKNFLIVPRPVRGAPAEILGCSEEQLKFFETEMHEHYDEFSDILPPKKYFERLFDMMKFKSRNHKCYIPYLILSIDGYGNIEQCPCGLIGNDNYNFMKKNNDFKNILLDSKYDCFQKYKQCKYCMNQYELLNLFIDGEITTEELKHTPSLNSDAIIKDVKKLRENINMNIIQKSLVQNYFEDVIEIEKNEESTDGNVYIILTKNGKFVAKIYKTIKHTLNMVNIHSTLVKNNINVPKIINTKENKRYYKIDDSHYIVVYSFVDGEQIGWSKKYKKLDNKIIIEIADSLKKIHNIKYSFLDDLDDVEYLKNDLSEKTLLHFDLTRNNILIDRGKIGIIDFDDAKKGSKICDVSILIANLFFSKTYGADTYGMNAFINEYFKDENTNFYSNKKKIKEYALKWIDYILDGNEFDSSTKESFEVKRKLINECL